MNEHTFWYLSRASGMVAWLVLSATCLWGILLITRMLKPADRPAWLLDLHRHLGALSVVTTGVHMLTLVGLVDGVNPCAFYVLVVVQVSSLLMKKLPRRLWHGIHLLSYVLFAMATVHGVKAGTDATNKVFALTATAVTAIVLFSLLARVLQGRAKRAQRPRSQPNVVTM